MTRTSPSALEQLVDASDEPAERADAAARLGLLPDAFYRVIAVPGSAELPGESVAVATAAGNVRLAVRGLGEELPSERAGIGLAQLPHSLDRSWASALLALRLTSRYSPIVRADDLGSVLLTAETADAATRDHSDLVALKFLLRSQPHALAVLEVLAVTADVRTVSTETRLHSETVRERSRDYVSALGFDVLSPRGRRRLALALALFRLQTNRFD